MKKYFSQVLSLLIEQLNKLKRTIDSTGTTDALNLPYESLSPTDNGDVDGHYSNALKWALENRKEKDIKNIALTGPYGSGKSSILKTFKKKYEGDSLKFLNISLATFKEEQAKQANTENGGTTSESSPSNNELLRLIEISILEQIFYSVSDEKVPDSRFKKIKSLSKNKLWGYTTGIVILVLSGMLLFAPKTLEVLLLGVKIENNVSSWIHWLCVGIILVALFLFVNKVIKTVGSINLNGFKVQDIEFGVGELEKKSVLNHHIDEIIYFFSLNHYNVVIFEDLDRFKENEIFTKLREINFLLSNSEKTKNINIVFIYSVRDDMFTDKERTKFFDFIIPVIPVINSSNSYGILLQKKEQLSLNLSKDFINNIAFFIDDMRLLHNIVNEFYIYKEKLNSELSQDKLFAIITYKNIYPQAFMELTCNKGEIFNTLNQKDSLIKEKIKALSEKTAAILSEIKEIEKINIESIEELRKIYLFTAVSHIDDYYEIRVNSTVILLEQLVKDEFFEYIKEDNYEIRNRYGSKINKILFKNIEEKISIKSYKEREIELHNRKEGKTISLNNELGNLEASKKAIRKKSFAELLSENMSSNILPDNNLTRMLLTNGYIAEDYLDYISLFHEGEGGITRTDYNFCISVKNGVENLFDYKLSKPEQVVDRLSISDYSKEQIYNVDLLNFLLISPDVYQEKITSIIESLTNESGVSKTFLSLCFERLINIEAFTQIICSRWKGVWNTVEANSEFDENAKNDIFYKIISHAKISDIVSISNYPSFLNKILSSPELLDKIEKTDAFIELLKELNIKFKTINYEISPSHLLNYIYKNNHYQINTSNIRNISRMFGNFDQIKFDNSNYAFIKSSNCSNLVSYIKDEINEYTANVYLAIESNINEEEDALVELLNIETLSTENKEQIINKIATKIKKLSKVSDVKLFPTILNANKALPTWENLKVAYFASIDDEDLTFEGNLADDYPEYELTDELIKFINNKDNYVHLSIDDSFNKGKYLKRPIPENELLKHTYFWKEVLQTKNINDEAYLELLKISPKGFDHLDCIDSLSSPKVKALIDKNIINPTIANFETLRKNNDLHIYLLERNISNFISQIKVLGITSVELSQLLNSTILTLPEKKTILENCKSDVIESSEVSKSLAELLLKNPSYNIEQSRLKFLILTNDLQSQTKIKLFNAKSNQIEPSWIGDFLTSLGSEYKKLTLGASPDIPLNEQNDSLLNYLQLHNYISSFSTNKGKYKVNFKRK